MNLKEIKDLIELVNDKGFAEFEIERQGFRLRISRFKESSSVTAHTSPPPIIISPAIPGPAASLTPETQRVLLAAEASSAESSETSAPQRVEASAVAPEPQIIKSPIVGTFYSAPSPSSDPFVRIGDRVEQDTVVCIIEAMKLMNEIQAEVSGEISRIYVENGQPVEYGQALFGIKTG